MKERPDERPLLSAGEEEFIGRIAEGFAPPKLSAARRAALDSELRDRIGEPHGPGFARPALAFASVVAGIGVVMALLWGEFEPVGEGPRAGLIAAESPSAAAWERDLFDPESFGDGDAGSDLEGLPDDYAAIAGMLLDG